MNGPCRHSLRGMRTLESPRVAGPGPRVSGGGLAIQIRTFNGCIGPDGHKLKSECTGCDGITEKATKALNEEISDWKDDG